MSNLFWSIIGSSAALLTMFGFVPQIIKIARTKSMKDVSILTLFQLSLGVSLWVAYGLYLRDTIIIVANSVTLLTLIILLFFYFYYGGRKQ